MGKLNERGNKGMKIGIPKEVQAGETRVALVPVLIPLLLRDQHEVLVEAGAGASEANRRGQFFFLRSFPSRELSGRSDTEP